MLVLSRCPSEGVFLDTTEGRILVKVLEVRGHRVSLGFQAPKAVKIVRTEVYQRQLKLEEESRANQDRNQQYRGIEATPANGRLLGTSSQQGRLGDNP